MALSSDELSDIVEKSQPIIRYTIGENEQHIIFHLQNEKEISISIKQMNGDVEALGQLRNKNQRGFGEANSVIKGDTELDVVGKVLDNLLGYYLKKENK